MKQYHSFDNKRTDTDYRKLVLFVCDIYATCTNNRLPHTIPTIVDNDTDVVYGVIYFQSWSLSDDKMAEYHTLLNSTLQCMDFVIEVAINEECTIKDLETKIAAITTDIAINGPQPDINTNNVRFVHCKCNSIKVSNAVVAQIGAFYFNIAEEVINRNSLPNNVKTLLLNIGLYPREWSSYYFDLLGMNGNCRVGATRDIDFCQHFVDTHLDKIRECLKLLLTDNPDMPKSTFTDDIEPFIMYTGH